MPDPLTQLTDAYDPMGSSTGYGLPVDNPYAVEVKQPSVLSSNIDKVINSLFRNDEKRLQLWPEKVVREGLSAAHDVATGETPQWAIDPKTGDVHTNPQMVEKAQSMAALAGTGGLGGTTDATLGATPFLRPALKYKDKLYKGKEGQQHMDVIPEALYPEFQKMAMSGEDISHYNFGFVNDKGHFLDREKALRYAIDTGLVDKFAGQYGALTSTLMADSTKPGVAIESLAKSNKPMESLIAKKSNVQMNADTEVLKNPTQKDLRDLAKDSDTIRTFTDKDGNLYAWDANKATHEGIANSLNIPVKNWGNEWFSEKGKLINKGDIKEGYPSWLKSGMLLSDSTKPGMAIEAMGKTLGDTKAAKDILKSGNKITPIKEADNSFINSLPIYQQHLDKNTTWNFMVTDKGIAGVNLNKIHGAETPTVEIHWLNAIDRGSGKAAIEQISNSADFNGVTLQLNAVPSIAQGEGKTLSKAKLEKFYEKLGFKKSGGRDADGYALMVRKPKYKFTPVDHEPEFK